MDLLYNLFQQIEFKYIWVLPFLLGLPVIAWFYFRTTGWRKSAMRVSTTHAFSVRTARNAWVHFPFWLRLLAVGCIVLALARPQIRNVSSRSKGQGIDIVLCLDVSGSMLSQDVIPNRLEVAKQTAIDFVKQRPVDQIGLVIFSGESFTQFPVSTDHAGLMEQIAGLKSGMLIDGTVIGEGLATSVERIKMSKARSKVIVLLTDGNEQPPNTRLIDPVTALEIAKAKGVKVYTIGLGASGARTVEEQGVPRNQGAAYLDETLLKRIAAGTNGLYFRATDRESLAEIYRQIDRLEKSEVQVVTRTRFQELFPYFLLAALFFLFIDILLRYTTLKTFP